MPENTRALGKSGEDQAARYLKKKGYSILFQNWRSGRYEIDIIARDRETLVFIEVKKRRTLFFGAPGEAVTAFKQKHIVQAAKSFLLFRGLTDKCLVRFDVVGIDAEGSLHHIQSAFDAE